MAGTISPPWNDRPGSIGSGALGEFAASVDVHALHFRDGLWVELELVQPERAQAQSLLQAFAMGSTSSESGGAEVDADRESTDVSCPGICMDLNGSDAPTQEDFSLVGAACGRLASSLECFDRGFGSDGYVDYMDVASWDWMLGTNCGQKGGSCPGNLCPQNYDFWLPASGEAQATALNMLPNDQRWLDSPMVDGAPGSFLVLGKQRNWRDGLPVLEYKDLLYSVDWAGEFKGAAPSEGLSVRCNMRLVRGSSGEVYVVDIQQGILDLKGRALVRPQSVSFDGKLVHVGIRGTTDSPWGRPVLDAIVDGQYAFVVPVLIQTGPKEAYLGAAKLELTGGGDFGISQLFADPDVLKGDPQNPMLKGLREIERDCAGRCVCAECPPPEWQRPALEVRPQWHIARPRLSG